MLDFSPRLLVRREKTKRKFVNSKWGFASPKNFTFFNEVEGVTFKFSSTKLLKYKPV